MYITDVITICITNIYYHIIIIKFLFTRDLSKNGEIIKLKKITVIEYKNTNKNINIQLVLLKTPSKYNIIVLTNESTIT